MSNANGTIQQPPKPFLAKARRRAPFYAIAIAVGLVVIAYIDGGEEPLHLIVQEIAANQSLAGRA